MRRVLVSDSSGTTIVVENVPTSLNDLPEGVSEGYDILVADDYPPNKAAEMCWAAHQGGRDVVAFARHFVKLRKAFRSYDE